MSSVKAPQVTLMGNQDWEALAAASESFLKIKSPGLVGIPGFQTSSRLNGLGSRNLCF